MKSLNGLWCLLVLACCIAGISSQACPDPCNCSPISESDCAHGLVWDACYCCQVCGKGEGEICSRIEGRCVDGLECVKDNLPAGISALDASYWPGVCKVKATTAGPTSATTSPTVPTTTTAPPASTEEASTTVTSTEASAESSTTTTLQPSITNNTNEIINCPQPAKVEFEEEEEICRNKCSVDFCSNPDRHKVCSAKGMEFSHVPSRGVCQHTSCRSCFLLVKPPSSCEAITCSEPPQKQCLRPYYQCIRNHVLGVSSNSPDPPATILNLDDPAAQHTTGKIICYVSELST